MHKPTFHLGDFCIDEPRPMKVVVIGAGFGGIIAGIRYIHPKLSLLIVMTSPIAFRRKLIILI